MKKNVTTALAMLVAVYGYSQTYLSTTGGSLTGQVDGTTATFNSGNLTFGGDGSYTSAYSSISFSGSRSDGNNRIFGSANGLDGLYLAAASGRAINFRPGGGNVNTLSLSSSQLTSLVPFSGTSASFNGDLHTADIYSSQWLRNSSPLTGLYHSGTATHFYSHQAGLFTLAGSGTANGGLKFAHSHEGITKGHVYWDTSGFGLLSSNNQWGLRINPGKTEVQDLLVLGMNTSVATDVKRGINFHDNTDEENYGIYREVGPWIHPYPDLRIAFHTGIKLGANYSYGGTRFFNDSNMNTELMSVGNGDNNVRVAFGLNVAGALSGTSANFTGPVAIKTSGVGTWGDFVVKSTSLWGDGCSSPSETGGTQYTTIGAGAAGIMIYNPHVTWNTNNNAAAIRYGKSGGVSSGIWWEAGVNPSGGFHIRNQANAAIGLSLDNNANASFTGNVSIGASSVDPAYKLTVAGKVHSREVKVTIDAGADFVFEKDYKLQPLTEVAQYISEKKHLPEIASAAEMKKNGLELGEMNIKLLQKIEELTLYLIEKDKQINILTDRVEQLEKSNYKRQ
jgi:hypothetical protein